MDHMKISQHHTSHSAGNNALNAKSVSDETAHGGGKKGSHTTVSKTDHGTGDEPEKVKQVGQKPENFFELLAAAVSKAKQDQYKGGPGFQEYLNKSGIKYAWVRAIVALYEESKKPDDPLLYILRQMGSGIPEKEDVRQIQNVVKQLRTRVLELECENDEMKRAIQDELEAQRNKDLVNIYDDGKYYSSSDDDIAPAGDAKGIC